ncbi:MAG: hypothetical protein ACRDJW_24475 [Thermomicrobiales bacterium]
MHRHGHATPAVSRRTLMAGGASALALGVIGWRGASVIAQEAGSDATPADPQALREKLQEFDFLWRATSPATHRGDEYALTLTNTTSTPQEVWVRAVVMDHRAHTNTVVIDEITTIAPGASQDLAAANDYGTANHFNTTLATKTDMGITLIVTVTAADGVQTATFNERAFMVDSRADLEAQAEARREAMRGRRRRRHGMDEHGGHGDEAVPEATPEE